MSLDNPHGYRSTKSWIDLRVSFKLSHFTANEPFQTRWSVRLIHFHASNYGRNALRLIAWMKLFCSPLFEFCIEAVPCRIPWISFEGAFIDVLLF